MVERHQIAIADDLRQLLGADRVADDQETLAVHATDRWFASQTPEVVVLARSTEDVVRTMKYASQHGEIGRAHV